MRSNLQIFNQEAAIKLQKKYQVSPASSLVQKIIQNNIKDHNEDYQFLMIRTKQLEIKIIQAEQQYSEIMRTHKKKRRKVDEFQQLISRKEAEVQKKRQYLNNYYNYIENKLKQGKGQLFAKLEIIEQQFQEKYDHEADHIKDSLNDLKFQYEKSKTDKRNAIQKRDYLQIDLEKIRGEMIENKGVFIKEEEPVKVNKKKDIEEENKLLNEQINDAYVQKRQAENTQKIIKKLINIEEEHKKYCLIIENGIKKAFLIGLKQIKYKEGVHEHYAKNLPDLKDIFHKKKVDKENLKDAIAEKRRKLAKLITDVSEKSKQYAKLEEEIVKKNK